MIIGINHTPRINIEKAGRVIIYFVIGILLLLMIRYFYIRYKLLNTIPRIDVHQTQFEKAKVVVDLRDYNNLSTGFIENAIIIPVPYLKRNYHEIPSTDVHIIAANTLEKNVGIRFLQKNGFHVTGYTIME